MRLKITLLALSSLFLMGMGSCEKKTDGYRCVLVTNDENGKVKPLEEWFWYCVNNKTEKEKTIWIGDSTHCIREEGPCKWVGTDLLEEEKFRKAYEEECKP